MGRIAAKYRLCRCRCKINGVMKEDTSLPPPPSPPFPPLILFIFPWLSRLLHFPNPYPASTSAWLFSPTLLCSDPSFRSCRLPRILLRFHFLQILSDVHPLSSCSLLVDTCSRPKPSVNCSRLQTNSPNARVGLFTVYADCCSFLFFFFLFYIASLPYRNPSLQLNHKPSLPSFHLAPYFAIFPAFSRRRMHGRRASAGER